MKGHIKRKIQGMFAVLLSVAMVVTCVPTTAFTAYAETKQENSSTDEGGAEQTPVAGEDSQEEGISAEDPTVTEDEDEGEPVGAEEPGTGDEDVSGEDTADTEEDNVSEELSEEEQENIPEEAGTDEDVFDIFDAGISGEAAYHKAVLFALGNDGLADEEDYAIAKADVGGNKGYDPWMHDASVEFGVNQGKWFVSGYEDRIDESTPENLAEDVPFYIGIDASIANECDTIKLSGPDEDPWLKSISQPVSLDAEFALKEDNAETKFCYYKAAITVSGQLRDCKNHHPRITLEAKAGGDVKFAAVFELCQTTLTPRYSKDNGKTWKLHGEKVHLADDESMQVDFVCDYSKETTGLIGLVEVTDGRYVTVQDISSSDKDYLASEFQCSWGHAGRYYIFKHGNQIIYPTITVNTASGEKGNGSFNVMAFDKDGWIISGCPFEYSTLPELSLRQVTGEDTYGDSLMQRDETDWESTINGLYLPDADKVFKFVLCDKSGNPIETNGEVYNIAPHDMDENNPTAPGYDAQQELELNVCWEGLGESIGLEDRVDGHEDQYARVAVTYDAVKKYTYLTIDASDIGFPFPETAEFDMWMDLWIVDAEYNAWQFRHNMLHAANKDLIVFGAGHEVDYHESPDNYKLYLDDQAQDRPADYDNSLYINLAGWEDKRTYTPSVYVRIPVEQAGTVTAENAAQDGWLGDTLTVTRLWDYTVPKRDENGRLTGETMGRYSYYRVTLPMDCGENWDADRECSFTITNTKNNKVVSTQTYNLYGAWLQYQIKNSADAWSTNDEDWMQCEGRTVDIKEGQSIGFKVVGYGMRGNPSGSACVTAADDDRWLIGYQKGSDTPDISADCLFRVPEITDNEASNWLKGQNYKYGEDGNYYIFEYGNDKEWYPEFELDGSKMGINRIRVMMMNQYGNCVCGGDMLVASRPDLGFKQDGGTVITNYFDKPYPDYNAYDPLQKAQKYDGAAGYSLRFYLYEDGTKPVKEDADVTYVLNEDEEFWFDFNWRRLSYHRHNDKDAMHLAADDDKNIYLEVDLSHMADEYEWLQEEGTFFDSNEQYSVDMSFAIKQVAKSGGDGLEWNYDYAMRHDREVAADSIQMFALGEWEDNAEALADMLDNDMCSKAGSSGVIAGSAGCFNQEKVPVYVKIPAGNMPDAQDVENLIEVKGELITTEITALGTHDGYGYYRILLSNEEHRLSEWSVVSVVVHAKEASAAFTIKGMIVRYQVASENESFDDSPKAKWNEFHGGSISLKAGDKIRFDVDGSIHPSNPKGMLDDVCSSMFAYEGLEQEPLDGLKEELGVENYPEFTYENNDNIICYNGLYIFSYQKGNARVSSYPVLTVNNYSGVTGLNVISSDAFGEMACGEYIEVSTLPELTLVQYGSDGTTRIGKALMQWNDAEELYGTDEYRNQLIIPDDGILRFYLCDAASGEKFDAKDFNIEGNSAIAEPEMKLWLHTEDGREEELHYTWVKENNNYYLQIDLSGKDNSGTNNNGLINGEDGIWLPDGYDMLLSFVLCDTVKQDRKWYFNYSFADCKALRQGNNEGNTFGEKYGEVYSDRYNLSSENINTIMPADDGILRFYFYELGWSEKNKIMNFVPSRGDTDALGNALSKVTIQFDKFSGEPKTADLYTKGGSNNLASVEKENGRWCLKVDLRNLEVDNVKLDSKADYYNLKFVFEKTVYGGNAPQKKEARVYELDYAPVTVLGWNEQENLGYELNGDMTADYVGRLFPYSKEYADASRMYRRDDRIVLYVRAPKNSNPEISLNPSERNNWVKTKEENWFKSLTVRKVDFDTMYVTGEEDSWGKYPVDNSCYEYYEVRLKGGERNEMTLGALAVKVGGVTYDFTLEQAMAQYRDAGSDDSVPFTDIKFEDEDLLKGIYNLEAGKSVKLNLATGNGLSDEGVIAMVVDTAPENAAIAFVDDIPAAAKSHWASNYEGAYGTLSDNMNDGRYFIFTYDDGETKTYYPTIKSSASDKGGKTILFHAVENDGNAAPEMKFGCRIYFENVSYNFHYEDEPGTALNQYKSAIPFADKEAVKLYIYENGEPFKVSASDFANLAFPDPEWEWNQLAIWFGDYNVSWGIDFDSNENIVTTDGVSLKREADGSVYIELDTARVKEIVTETGYDLNRYPYDFMLRVPIVDTSNDRLFVVENLQSYLGDKVGAKVVTGKTSDGHEIFVFAENGGSVNVNALPGANGGLSLSVFNMDTNSLDLDYGEEIAVSSSAADVIRVENNIKCKGEDKYTNILHDYAKLNVLKSGSSTISFTVPVRKGEPVDISFELTAALIRTITFNANGGSAVSAQTVPEGGKVSKPADPTKENLIFGGWYREPGCKTKWDFDKDVVTVDMTLYAKWNWVTESPEDKEDTYYDYAETERVDLSVSATGAEIARIKDKVFDGKPYMPTVKVTALVDGKKATLTEGTDYRVIYDKNVSAGTGKAIVKGNGIYTGEISKEFTIKPKSMKKLKAVAGSMQKGASGKPMITIYDGSEMLAEDVDYELVIPSDLTDKKGNKKVEVKAKAGSNYEGSLNVSVPIVEPKSNDKVLSPADTIIVLEYTTKVYNGSACKPTVTVLYENAALPKKNYAVKYANNTNAGTAYVTVTGKSGYCGSIVTSFEITVPETKLTLKKDMNAVTFSGKLQKPKLTVQANVADGKGKVKVKSLKSGKDYIVMYQNNLHANSKATENTGKAAVIVKGIGNYDGLSETFYFTIKEQLIKKASVKGTRADMKLIYAKKTLKEGTDYSAEFGTEKNKKVPVTITGLGDFAGSEVKKSIKVK